jgi:hypothetical protein
MNETERQALVFDFIRALGYEPDRVSEVHIEPQSLTVRGYALNEEGRKFLSGPGEVATFEDTYQLRVPQEAAS